MRKALMLGAILLVGAGYTYAQSDPTPPATCDYEFSYDKKFIAYIDDNGNVIYPPHPPSGCVINPATGQYWWDCNSVITQNKAVTIPAGTEVSTWIYTYDKYAGRSGSTASSQSSERIRIEYLDTAGNIVAFTTPTCDLADGVDAADNSDGCVTAGGTTSQIPKATHKGEFVGTRSITSNVVTARARLIYDNGPDSLYPGSSICLNLHAAPQCGPAHKWQDSNGVEGHYENNPTNTTLTTHHQGNQSVFCAEGTLENMTWNASQDKWTWSCTSGTRSSSCEIGRRHCGDNYVSNGEQCDDGNTNNTDTCNNQCQNTTPAIDIKKWKTVGTDSQTINSGGTATFTVVVTNTGSQRLNAVSTVDAKAPDCARTSAQVDTLEQAIGNGDTWLDPSESFTYTCSRANVTNQFAGKDNSKTGDRNNANYIEVHARPDGATSNIADTDTTTVNVNNPGACGNLDGTIQYTTSNPTNTTLSVPLRPAAEYCANGNASEMAWNASSKTWTWKCTPPSGGAAVSCSAEGRWCGDGREYTSSNPDYNEQCDDGNTNNTDACNNQCENTSPAIDIKKWKTVGTDSQTINSGGTATFTIVVTNTGTEDLKGVTVSDPEATDCSRTYQEINVLEGSNNLLNVGQSIQYTCTKTNVTISTFGSDKKNTATVTGAGNSSNTNVNDSDPSTVNVNVVNPVCGSLHQTPIYDNNPTDADARGKPGSQYCSTGYATQAVWNAGQNRWTWSCANIDASPITCYQPRTYCGDGDENHSSEQCDDGNTNNTDACSNTCTTNTPAIDIKKWDGVFGNESSDAAEDTQTLYNGGTSTFTIVITNTGTEDLKGVTVSDPEATNCSRTYQQINVLEGSNNLLNVGQTITYTCTKPNTTRTTFGSDNKNTATVTGTGNSSNTNVTDNDPSTVVVQYCGDDDINGNEVCDDGADNGKVGYCNASCTGTVVPTCGSQNGRSFYSTDGNGNGLSSSAGNLCPSGSTAVQFGYRATEGKWTWRCSENGATSGICLAYENKCGDGSENHSSEQCDDGNNKDGDGCSATCENEPSGSCGGAHGNTFYTNSPSSASLEGQSGLCSSGAPTFINWVESRDGVVLRRWEYGCEGGGSIDMCRVHQIFCGDGRLQTNNGETCDDGNTNPTDACNDSCQPNTPEITIEKDDADDSDDAQQVVSGGTATFTITVRNSGTESLKNVVVGDALASDCYRSAVDTAALYTGSTFDPGESFEYTCQRDNVQEETFPMDKNVATVSARGVGSDTPTSATDDTNIVVTKDAVCGGANGTNYYTNNPSDTSISGVTSLCATGIAGGFTFSADTNTWSYTCSHTGANDTCTMDRIYCGDGNMTNSEVCDDGNTDNNDACSNTCTVTTPRISINKDDAESVHDDTQAVTYNGTATFTITVKNEGTEDLINVTVTDAEAPNCNKTIGALAAGEEHTYTCTDENITEGYTNTAAVIGTGKASNTDVNDQDDTDVTVTKVAPVCGAPNTPYTNSPANDTIANSDNLCATGTPGNFVYTASSHSWSYICTSDDMTVDCSLGQLYCGDGTTNGGEGCDDGNDDNSDTCKNDCTSTQPSISIVKDDAESNDTDDEQTVPYNGQATFTITVTNTGSEDLINVVINDPLAPNCDKTIGVLAVNASDTYTCTDAGNNTSDYTNTASVTGEGKDSGTNVSASDPTDVVVSQVDPICGNPTNPYTNSPVDDTIKDLQNLCKAGVAGGFTYMSAMNGWTYTCTSDDVTIDCAINQLYCGDGAQNGGEACDDGNDNNNDACTNTCTVNNPSIEIVKSSQNNGADTQEIPYNGTAKFTITVTNNGSEDLTNLVITDEIVSNCDKTFTSLAVGASETYTCEDDGGNQQGYTNTVKVTATGATSGTSVEDEDPTVITISTQSPECKTVDPLYSNSPADVELKDLDSAVYCTTGIAGNWSYNSVNGNWTYTCTNDGESVICPVARNYCGDGTVNGTTDHPEACDDGNNNNTDACSNTCTTNAPAIKITKNTDGADSQQITSGGSVTFNITVTNTGNEDLKNVIVTDALVPTCDTTFTSLAVGATETYTCTDTNVTSAYTNTINVTAKGVNTDTDVNDSDISSVTIAPTNTSIDIKKNDNDNGDDTQQINSGAAATFTIIVTNTGSEALQNIIITDNEEPNCARDAATTLALMQNQGKGATLDAGESFTYACTGGPRTNGYTNTASVSGNGVTSGSTVTDSDTSLVTVASSGGGGGGGGGSNDKPSIKIEKENNTDSSDTQKVKNGSKATFKITVTNDGEKNLDNVIISDALSPGCSRTASETEELIEAIGDRDDRFDENESFSYTCESNAVTENFTNTASVTGQEIGGGRTVSDNDDSKVTTEPAADPELCTGINFTSERSATESLTLTGSCEGSGDEDFIFEVFRSGTKISTTETSANFREDLGVGSYSVTCRKKSESAANKFCKKNVSVFEQKVVSCSGVSSSRGGIDSPVSAPFMTELKCEAVNQGSCQMRIVKDGVEVSSFNRCEKNYTFEEAGQYEVLCGLDNNPATNVCRTSIRTESPTLAETGPRSVFLMLLALVAGVGAYFARRKKIA